MDSDDPPLGDEAVDAAQLVIIGRCADVDVKVVAEIRERRRGARVVVGQRADTLGPELEQLFEAVDLVAVRPLEIDPQDGRATEAWEALAPIVDFLDGIAFEEERGLHPLYVPVNDAA